MNQRFLLSKQRIERKMAEFAAHGADQEEKMAAEKAKKTIVIGHKNPDTDSICSAIGYANFKTLQTGGEYVPCRAGELNPETTFVLDYFKVDVPKLIKSVKTQVKDVEIRETPGVSKNISLRKAWNLMQEDGLVTLPAVTDKNILEGLITVGDITRSYMNVYDSSILSKACTSMQISSRPWRARFLLAMRKRTLIKEKS